MDRIIDANLNRASEALRILEEIARFYLDDNVISSKIKNIRHEISKAFEYKYEKLLNARDTQNDVGTEIKSPTKRSNLYDIFKANFKRLQQALRVLAEYSFENAEIFEKARYESYILEKDMHEKLKNKLNHLRLKDKHLYLVTDSSRIESEDKFLDNIAQALDGGVDIVQLREKTAPAKTIIRLATKIKHLCAEYNALFIINDRVDIAHYVEADGVHLGQDDIDIKSAREILGNHAIIGLSTHAPEQALKAVEIGADYIGVGPVFETPTKPGRKSVGLEYVEWATQNIDIPFFAIGGLNLENIADVTNAGANRIAVVRAIINAENPKKAAEEFLLSIKN